MWFLENAWLIPVVPSAGYFVILLLGKRFPLKGAEVGIATLSASFVLACGTLYQWVQHVDAATGGGGGALGAVRALGRSVLPAAAGGEGSATYVAPVIRQWTWWQVGDLKFTLGTQVDGLSVVIMFVVALIATLIELYSIEYVKGDRRFCFFFSALTLFAAGMLCMVVAESTVQFILGWEIMGLCSFMLIGHWWEDYANARAALKAFFTVRVGDVGILVGMSVLYFGASSYARGLGTDGFSIFAISGWALSGTATKTVLLWGGVALFIAAIGKSGQFPLHTWLPDAMAGPTPVSALLHSSTMVVGGVYLVARFYPVFYEGFKIGDTNINMIALIGGITIIIAAVLAFVQVDIKRVLAYSTVSQLGYMIMGLGVGAWTPAVFHIVTHAFFKACLFLGAGSVSHSASHHSFDMKKDMGGLWRKMPITFATFVIASAALAGIFPLAGFFSKDEIIDNAGFNGYHAFQTIGLIGAFLTAAYMTRCVYLTFLGQPRGAAAGHVIHGDEEHELARTRVREEEHGAVAVATMPATAHGDHGDDGAHDGPHESNWLITFPLVILGFGALLVGLLNAPAFKTEAFTKWVQPAGVVVPVDQARAIEAGDASVVPPPQGTEGSPCGTTAPADGVCFAPELQHAPFEWSKALVALAIVFAGIAAGGAVCWAFYKQRSPRLVGLTDRNRLAKAGYAFLANRYYLDFLYEKGVVAAISGPIARATYWTNQEGIDGVVNGIGHGAVLVADATYDYVDQGLVDGLVNGAGNAAEGSGEALRPVQSGKVNLYGALLFGAAAVGALILVIVV